MTGQEQLRIIQADIARDGVATRHGKRWTFWTARQRVYVTKERT